MRKTRTLALAALGLFLIPAPAQSQVLDLGDGGAFTNAINPSNIGRATPGAFWDNNSADNNPPTNCNAGFFAIGNFSVNCRNQTAGTFGNQGGYSYYFGNGASGFGSPAFMFSGVHGYDLSLIGAVSGRNSEIGIFTRSYQPVGAAGGFVYNFTALPGFGSKTIGSTFHISPGMDWGFYIKNLFNPQAGGCGTSLNCSDATGGFSTLPFQQFALFSKYGVKQPTPFGQFLVGAEDNALEVLPNNFSFDSDYNDYLIAVTATPEPVTMGLLATGLVGIAGVGFIRRRRENNDQE